MVIREFGDALGFGGAPEDTKVSFTNPDQFVDESAEDLAGQAEERIETNLDPETDSPVARAIFQAGLRNIEGQRQRNIDQARQSLEKRNIQDSGILNEVVSDVNRQSNQALSQLNNRQAKLQRQRESNAIQRALQNLQQERNFATSKAGQKNKVQQANAAAERAADQRLVNTIAGGAGALASAGPDSLLGSAFGLG